MLSADWLFLVFIERPPELIINKKMSKTFIDAKQENQVINSFNNKGDLAACLQGSGKNLREGKKEEALRRRKPSGVTDEQRERYIKQKLQM